MTTFSWLQYTSEVRQTFIGFLVSMSYQTPVPLYSCIIFIIDLFQKFCLIHIQTPKKRYFEYHLWRSTSTIYLIYLSKNLKYQSSLWIQRNKNVSPQVFKATWISETHHMKFANLVYPYLYQFSMPYLCLKVERKYYWKLSLLNDHALCPGGHEIYNINITIDSFF